MDTPSETAPETASSSKQPQSLPSGGKLHRMSAHMQGLVEDLQTWIELKMKLTQMEIEEQVDIKVNALIRTLIMGVFAALAGFFLLVTAALFLGWALGHPAWGFLIVTLLLGLAVLTVKQAEPRLAKIAKGYIRMQEGKTKRGRAIESEKSN